MKRLLYILFITPVSILSLLTVIYLTSNKNLFFMIRDIKIKGTKQIEESEVIKRISPFLKETILSIDAKKIREAVLTHPFIKDVRVKSVFPFSIVIEIEEKKPSALWLDRRGNIMVLDENGEPYRTITKGMIKDMFIINTKEKCDAKDIFKEINSWIADGIIKKEQISEVVYSEGNITLFLNSEGIEVILGKDALKKRLKTALIVLEDAKKKGLLIKCIDARFEKGAIIQERQV